MVSLVSIIVSGVGVLIIVLMKDSLLIVAPLGVKLGSVVVNFLLDYLMLGVLVFGVVLVDVGVILLVLLIMVIITGKMLNVELT